MYFAFNKETVIKIYCLQLSIHVESSVCCSTDSLCT